MTLNERSELHRFLQLLVHAQPGVKDAEAEALIREAFMRQPDAGYLLVQRVMQLEHALLQANQAQQRPGFVGDPNAWGRAPVTPVTPSARQAAALHSNPPVAPVAQRSAWGSGLMGTVASTAAGVVAGSLLAQGIGSLFGHHNAAQAATADPSTIPPGGGTVVDTDYGASNNNADNNYAADDYSSGGDSGDLG